ncbi:DUF6901 family protein [Candidatus Omnitrophota bacterium]
MSQNSANIITYNYKFTFDDGTEKEFNVQLDNKTLDLIQPAQETYPQWSELKCSQCPNCPLDEQKHKFCPAAVALIDLITFCKNLISYTEVDVEVDAGGRRYAKRVSLQKGLSSLMGIYMAASGCPIMEKFKPMVRYHLPFATPGETRYRVISMYLLAQYFLRKQSKPADWELKDLVKIYAEVIIVNKNFFNRLANIKIQDATLNALINLDSFAQSASFSIDQGALQEIELLFKAYLRGQSN